MTTEQEAESLDLPCPAHLDDESWRAIDAPLRRMNRAAGIDDRALIIGSANGVGILSTGRSYGH